MPGKWHKLYCYLLVPASRFSPFPSDFFPLKKGTSKSFACSDGKRHPVYYASRALSATAATERQCAVT